MAKNEQNNSRKKEDDGNKISSSTKTNLNTDGKEKGEWKSIYPKEATDRIRIELLYVIAILAIALIATLLNWLDFFTGSLHPPCNKSTLTTFIYYAAGGLLGGATFSGKYLYRVVGRGYWNQDRWVWRILSPFISLVIGVIIGAMVECGVVDSKVPSSGTRSMVIGFLAGYFADKAVGYMCDIADVLFGKRN